MAIKKGIKIIAENRKAYHDYYIDERYEAGVALSGTEVKSLRAGKVNLKDSYVQVKDGEMWLIGVHISPYENGNRFNLDPERNRKLLMHKKEIIRLYSTVKQDGLTLVPTKVYLKGNLVKMQVSLCRGKALHDKKETIKERDLSRQAQREARDYRF